MRCWGQFDRLPLPILGRHLLVVLAPMVLSATHFLPYVCELVYLSEEIRSQCRNFALTHNLAFICAYVRYLVVSSNHQI